MSLPLTIGLYGVAQSGKDTVARILHDLYGYQRLSFADQLRSFIYNQDLWTPWGTRVNDLVDEYGWEFAKVHESYIRGVLLTTGTEAGRALDPDLWVNAAHRHAPKGLLAATDMRFPNELESVIARGGVTWRITRPGFKATPHISDHALDHHIFDQHIDNDGTVRDLAQKVVEAVTWHQNDAANLAHNGGVRAGA